MRIEMKEICKSFGDHAVLTDAGLTLENGEIHALMGENGAGKSTLMKILTGIYEKDSGTILTDGKAVVFKTPKEAEKAGIVLIHQELNVLFDLTVEENLFLGKEITVGGGICNKKEMQKQAKTILEKLGVNIPVKKRMAELAVGQQQMIEICRALMSEAKVIIMDEPTAALTAGETEILFKVIKTLQKEGVSIIYISHRMEEIFELCDRITVLRDGQYVGTKETKETNEKDIVKMMIGREIGERYPERKSSVGKEILRVSCLTRQGTFENISFSVREGEVLGVSGLMGAGRTEIMRSVFGNLQHEGGDIFIDGQKCTIDNPAAAIKYGIGFITEDRKSEGLMLEDSIKNNITLTNLKSVSDRYHVINKGKEKKFAQNAINELKIRCFHQTQECGKLSGGNQQKVVFAKWVYTNPRILILDEPTRGVDVGAKKEIYNIINELAAKGVAIIMVSSELPEILGMSDRIMIIREGTIRGILNREEANQEKIMTLATGGKL